MYLNLFFRVEPNDIGNIIRVVVPDIAMFIVSLVVFILCRKFIPRQTQNEDDPNLSHAESFSSVRTRIIQTTVLVNLFGAVPCRLIAGSIRNCLSICDLVHLLLDVPRRGHLVVVLQITGTQVCRIQNSTAHIQRSQSGDTLPVPVPIFPRNTGTRRFLCQVFSFALITF